MPHQLTDLVKCVTGANTLRVALDLKRLGIQEAHRAALIYSPHPGGLYSIWKDRYGREREVTADELHEAIARVVVSYGICPNGAVPGSFAEPLPVPPSWEEERQLDPS
jgi:hypothetical protein